MNYAQEKVEAVKFFEDCKNLLVSKAHDYATDVDCMVNFKKTGYMVNIQVEKTFVLEIAKKLTRLVNIIDSDKPPLNEGLDDTLKDMANYSCLLFMFLKDKHETTNTFQKVS